MEDQDSTPEPLDVPEAAASETPPLPPLDPSANGAGNVRDKGDPPPGPSARTGDGGMANSFGSVETQSFSTIQSQINHHYQSRTILRHFTSADAEPVSDSWEAASERSFRATDDEIDALLHHLEERRVLLLDAARGAGRVMAAIALGRRLRSRGNCDNPTLLVQSLDRHVRVDVRQVASGDTKLGSQLVIFRDTLGRVEKADRSGWRQLEEQLRERKSYVVFITDSGGGVPDDLSGLLKPLSRHPRTLLGAELDDQVAELERRGTHAPEVLAVLRERREWLLDTFAYAPQLNEFVSLYADLNLPGLDLEEAWRRFHDTGGRLLRDRDGDLEGWAAVFALTMAQCVRDARGARWVDFDGLHRRVREWLHADLRWRSRERRDAEDGAAEEPPPEFSDEPLLKAAHAEEYVDVETLAWMVRFRNGIPPEQLWAGLLRNHRRALVTALPGLRGLAEEGTPLSILAARVVGRLGEMDPDRVVVPAVAAWMHGSGGRHHGLLGPLFEGVLGSGSEAYRTVCLRYLRSVRQGTGAPGGTPNERLPAVVAAYSWIGDYEFAHAMAELAAIAREHLAPMIAGGQQASRLLTQVENSLEERNSVLREAVLLSYHARLLEWAYDLYSAKGHIFVALQLTLNSLCATRGPVPVLAQLRKWIAEGGWTVGVLVALMFLQENGIADDLKKAKVTAAGHPGVSCNPLVVWMGEGDDEVRQVARFLGDVFESLSTRFLVARGLQRFCAASLEEHLTDWIRDSLPVDEYARAMKTLIESLAALNDGMLRNPLAALLRKPAFLRGDPRMSAFAASVRL